jgi:hypothetical protein
VYHAEGFSAELSFDEMRTYSAPEGHLYQGHSQDYPTTDRVAAVTGLLAQAFEVIAGVDMSTQLPGPTDSIGRRIGDDVRSLIRAGGVDAYTGAHRAESGVIVAAAGLLPSGLSTLRPEQHGLPLFDVPTWNGNPITWEKSVAETQDFLRSDRVTAQRVLTRAIDASNLIANKFIEAQHVPIAPLTRSRYGQVTPEVIQQRKQDEFRMLLNRK